MRHLDKFCCLGFNGIHKVADGMQCVDNNTKEESQKEHDKVVGDMCHGIVLDMMNRYVATCHVAKPILAGLIQKHAK